MSKHTLKILLLFLLLPWIGSAKTITAFFNYATFYHPVEGPYLEMHYKIPASTLTFERTGDGLYQTGVEIMVLVTGEKGDTAYYDNYLLNSPPVKDTSNADFNMLDLRRTPLKNGQYTISLELKDHKTGSKAEAKHTVTLSKSDAEMNFSDILLIDTFYPAVNSGAFSRAGYDFIPLVWNYYPKNQDKMTFYAELYNTDNILSDSDGKVIYYITDAKGQPLPGLRKVKVLNKQRINYYFDGFRINKLSDGPHLLVVEARNGKGDILTQKQLLFFKNTIPGMEEEKKTASLDDLSNKDIYASLDYMDIIASQAEADQIKAFRKNTDSTAMRSFFIRFWESHGNNAAAEAYYTLMTNGRYADANFKAQGTPGHRSDRGRAILKYGKPNYVSPYIDESAAFPYEIWQYYRLNAQTNVRFIFYNPTQIDNDYILLTSDLVGERKNPNWKQYIYRRVSQDTSPYQNNQPPTWGNHADDRIRE